MAAAGSGPATGEGSANNLFGVKAGRTWQGASVKADTTEYTAGAAQRVAQGFRSYGSIQQGVNDYVSLLTNRGGYRDALGSGQDAGAFASALQRGGYATDPDYVHKLVATTASVRSLRALPDVASSSASGFKLLAGAPIQGGEEPT